jgi:hypothetical protein
LAARDLRALGARRHRRRMHGCTDDQVGICEICHTRNGGITYSTPPALSVCSGRAALAAMAGPMIADSVRRRLGHRLDEAFGLLAENQFERPCVRHPNAGARRASGRLPDRPAGPLRGQSATDGRGQAESCGSVADIRRQQPAGRQPLDQDGRSQDREGVCGASLLYSRFRHH